MTIGRKLATLATAATLAYAGCDQAKQPESKPYNPNRTFALVNIYADENSTSPHLVVDEDRDGYTDFIASWGPSSTQFIYWVREEGYVPRFGNYVITPNTRVMTPEIREWGDKALHDQMAMDNAIQSELHRQKKNP